MMSKTTPNTESEFESRRLSRWGEPAERVLVVPRSQQEMVVAADCDRDVVSRYADLPLRHGSDTIHLHPVLSAVELDLQLRWQLLGPTLVSLTAAIALAIASASPR